MGALDTASVLIVIFSALPSNTTAGFCAIIKIPERAFFVMD